MKPVNKAKAPDRIKSALDASEKALTTVIAERDALKKSVADVNDRLQAIEDRQRIRAAAGIGMRPEEVKQFSISKAYRGAALGDWTDADFERQAMEAATKKRLDVVRGKMEKTATAGNPANLGFIIPNEVSSEIINPLRSELFLSKLGVKMRTGLKAVPFEMNRKADAGATLTWIAEGTAISASDVASMDRILMYPHTAAMATRISKKLLETGGQAAEAEIRESLNAQFERGLEKHFMEGTTASGGPQGIIPRAGNTNAIGDNADAKILDLQEMIGLIAVDNVPTGNLKWFMPEAAWQSLTRIQVGVSSASASTTLTPSIPLSGAGAVGWQMINGVPQKTLWGYPVVTTTNATATASDTYTVVLADWSYTVFADWGPADIGFEESGETLRLARQALIYAFYDCDFTVEQPNAICTGTDFDVP